MNAELRRTLTAAGAFLALALVLTWPLCTAPASFIPGGARTDAPNAVWSLWLVHDALSRGVFPLQTNLLDFPDGGRLVVADPLNALLGYPLVALFGPVAAYSLLVIGHLWAAGLFAWRLGRELGGSGWVAGVGYMSAPLLLSHVQNGSSEAVAAGWLPLAAWLLIRAIERGGAGRVLLAALGLFFAALGGSWYGGVGVFVFASMILVWGWPGLPRLILTRRLLPAMVLGALLAAPVAVAIKSVAVAEDGLVDIKNPEDLSRIRRTIGAADPRVWLAPLDFRSPDFLHLEGNPSDRVHTAYLGFVLLALALWPGNRIRGRAAWWWGIAASLVLAMGPVLVINGFPFALGGRAIPLPYAALEGLPGFSSLSLLYRLAALGVLGVAVLADRGKPAFALLVLAEVYLLSPARHLPELTPIPELPAALVLATEPEGAVVNVPVVPGRNFLYEQVLHHKPVTGSLNTSVNRSGLQVLAAARKMRSGELTLSGFVAVAQGLGVRYVVQHKNVMAPEAFLSAILAITRNFEPIAQDDKIAVYRLW